MANTLPPTPPVPPGAASANEQAARAPGAPFVVGDAYDADLKRAVRLQLPESPLVTDDEIELFGRLFGDLVDQALSPKDTSP